MNGESGSNCDEPRFEFPLVLLNMFRVSMGDFPSACLVFGTAMGSSMILQTPHTRHPRSIYKERAPPIY